MFTANSFFKSAASLAVLLSSAVTATETTTTQQCTPTCDCFTATTTISTQEPTCSFVVSTCIVPLCLSLTTTTIPGPNSRCPYTPTLTFTPPCQTECPRGCATSTSTITADSPCLVSTRTSTVTQSRPCSTTKTVGPTPTIGGLGDACNRYLPPGEVDPPCGPGLTCVTTDPDLGGTCQLAPYTTTITTQSGTGSETTTTMTVGPTLPLAGLGDACDRFFILGAPYPGCESGLTCLHTDPSVLGGTCQLASSPTSSTTQSTETTWDTVGPTPSLAGLGDACNRFFLLGAPYPSCESGLTCVNTDPNVLGGICQLASHSTTTTTQSQSSSTTTTISTTVTVDPTSTFGGLGAPCLRFLPPGLEEPPCGPGLTCVINEHFPRLGGTCQHAGPSTTTSKTTWTSTIVSPTPTFGGVGDPCQRFLAPPNFDPSCGPGLTCSIIDPWLPDLGGICQVALPSTTSTTTYVIVTPGYPTTIINPGYPLTTTTPWHSTTITISPGYPTVPVPAETGGVGDFCGRFLEPPGDPPCGEGLQCVFFDEQVPDIGGTCAPIPSKTVGYVGDDCGRYTFPPDPPCASGLQCDFFDLNISDLGGTCAPVPTGTFACVGDPCGRFIFPGDPPCAPGLECDLINPEIIDLGGTCTPVSTYCPTPYAARTGV
ncbi:hypothetical protein M011DRAFT_195668 [Sporormia fimetaria CBS 119925]|uniref:IGFBP N-terminal domain-containing protein n=1 Tax=Sporormia fimetaria CBS 119925 TaxID=1340428 RepID=A0A6A6V2P6_9PLEO|nr:hypothetical protein M011DRAFT_195668 [Sporormia fimetaria CBS 119925]